MFLICSFFPSDINLICTYFSIPVTSANSLILLKKCFHCPFLLLSLFFLHPSLCCLNSLSISCHFSSLPESVKTHLLKYLCNAMSLSLPLQRTRNKCFGTTFDRKSRKACLMPESTRPITHTQMSTDQVSLKSNFSIRK